LNTAMTRRRRVLSAAALVHIGAETAARGQARPDWPRRAVRIVVPYAAGGGTDIFVRTLAEGLRPIIGQAVVVESRPGANGAVGSEAVARGDADGHLLLMPTGSHVMNRYSMASLPYDPVRDFAPVSLLSRFPTVPVASSTAPFHDVAVEAVLADEELRRRLADLAARPRGARPRAAAAAHRVRRGALGRRRPGVRLGAAVERLVAA